MGSNIERWGPSGWNMLHVIAHKTPELIEYDTRQRLKKFLYSFSDFIPCLTCKRHFTKYLTEHLRDEDLATRRAFVAFLNDAHNAVNARLGKRTYTVEEHYRVYATRRPAPVRSALAVLLVVSLVVYMCHLKKCRGRW